MCVQALPFFTFLGAGFFPKLSLSATNVRFLPCILPVDGPMFSPTTSCTGHLKLRSTLKNICCSKGTYVHRTDVCDRLGFVFLGLFARADGPLFPGLGASLHPLSAPQGRLSIRSCTCFPPVCIYFCSHVPLYVPLSCAFARRRCSGLNNGSDR